MTRQHVHRYRRLDIGKKVPYWVMACTLPGCTSYTPMKTVSTCPALEGKVAVCNKCGDRFILDKMSLRKAKPICVSCVDSPLARKLRKAERFFEKMEGEISE
jgi:hypothetical protein